MTLHGQSFHGPCYLQPAVHVVQTFTVGIPPTLGSGGLLLPPGPILLARPECYEPTNTTLVPWPKQIPFLQLCQHLPQDLDQNTSPPCSFLGAFHA